MDAIVFPRLDKADSLPIRMRFIDDDDNELLSVNYLDLKPVQFGTKIRKWKAHIPNIPMQIVVTFDFETKKIETTMSRTLSMGNNNNPRTLLGYFRFVEIYNKSERIEFEILRNGKIFKHQTHGNVVIDAHDEYVLAIENLVFIMNTLNVDFSVPNLLMIQDIESIKNVVSILKTGVMNSLIAPKYTEERNYLDIYVDREIVKEYIDSVENYGVIMRYSSESLAKILEVKTDLGASEIVFVGTRLHNDIEVATQFEDNSEKIKLTFTFDYAQSYTQFPKWLPEDTNNA